MPNIVVSPGSAILFTSTLCCILVLFHSEGIKKTRKVIFGIIFCNILLSVLSAITINQINSDNHSIHKEYLQEILNFDVPMFLIGSIVLFLDFFIIILIYQFINLSFNRLPFFFKLLLPVSISALFDSVFYYSTIFIDLDNGADLLFSNILGKQLTILIFSFTIYLYLKYSNISAPKEKPTKMREVISVFVSIDDDEINDKQ